jgi:hypothetical protein
MLERYRPCLFCGSAPAIADRSHPGQSTLTMFDGGNRLPSAPESQGSCKPYPGADGLPISRVDLTWESASPAAVEPNINRCTAGTAAPLEVE